jgi:single-strand DNA-binding protein
MVNKVILLGRLGKDPEMRYTPQGSPVTTFSLATERVWHDQEGKEHRETEWHNVVAWNKLAEACNQYLKKGSLVYLEGRLHTRTWEDEQKVTHRWTEVIAEEVKFLDGRRDRHRTGRKRNEDLL